MLLQLGRHICIIVFSIEVEMLLLDSLLLLFIIVASSVTVNVGVCIHVYVLDLCIVPASLQHRVLQYSAHGNVVPSLLCLVHNVLLLRSDPNLVVVVRVVHEF